MKALDLRSLGTTCRTLLFSTALFAAGAISNHATAQTTVPKTCFPSCDTTDGRFLSLAGADLESLAGDQIRMGLNVPANASALNLEIFDGDTGGLWDLGSTPLQFLVYADATGDGLGDGDVLVDSFTGVGLPDNAWYARTIPTSENARLAPGDNFHYTVLVKFTDPYTPGTWSNFKVRANADLILTTKAFAFAAPLFTESEARIIFPNYNSASPSSAASMAGAKYDGTWDFYMQVNKAQAFGDRQDTGYVEIWDGDMDYGSYDGTINDTDDPNTPNAPFLPEWAVNVKYPDGTTVARPEGVAVGAPRQNAGGVTTTGNATGYPPDNNRPSLITRGSSVTYSMTDPNGVVYANNNPSGNLEWERFRVSPVGTNANNYDYLAASIPDGLWKIHVDGMDMSNLNAWRTNFPFVGVCTTGVPCNLVPTCVDCPLPGPCQGKVLTKSYWKTHTSAWPVNTVTIGGHTLSKTQAIAILSACGNDKFNIIASQLITAKLNVANGASTSCIITTLSQADAWVRTYWSAHNSCGGSSWNSAYCLASRLASYNNGLLCVAHCDSDTNGGCRSNDSRRHCNDREDDDDDDNNSGSHCHIH